MKIKYEGNFIEPPNITVSQPDATSVQSERKYQLVVSLRLGDFTIYEIRNGEERPGNQVGRLSPLRINLCNLRMSVGGESIILGLSNNDPLWMSHYNIPLYRTLETEDIEHLSKLAGDKTIHIGIEIEGIAKVDNSILDFQLKFIDNQFKLGTDEFEDKFLKNTGLQYAYNRTFLLKTPLFEGLSSKPALNELYDRVSTLHNNLEQALRALRFSTDYVEVLALIRQPLDRIRGLKNNALLMDDLASDLYVTKKVFADFPPKTGGAQIAAREVVDELFTIFDVLFGLSSKALHTKTRSRYQTPPPEYLMNPEYCDAEFSLTLALNITNYLLDRIKHSLS
jgi:hypothetical protein